MFRRFLLVLALSLACAGCDSITDFFGITTQETLELPLPSAGDGNPYHHNSLDDYQGLAGLRVEFSGAIKRTFTAEDLPVAPFSVGHGGWVDIEVSLTLGSGRQDTLQVAWGEAWLALKPNFRWELWFSRGGSNPAPSFPPSPGEPAKPCSWPGCQDYWRFEIVDDYSNHDGEALWLVLMGSTPCPKDVICN